MLRRKLKLFKCWITGEMVLLSKNLELSIHGVQIQFRMFLFYKIIIKHEE